MTTTSFNQSYRDKVFTQLYKMQVGELFSLDKSVHPERQQQFINQVKELIREDLLGNDYIEFSDDYKFITKKSKP